MTSSSRMQHCGSGLANQYVTILITFCFEAHWSKNSKRNGNTAPYSTTKSLSHNLEIVHSPKKIIALMVSVFRHNKNVRPACLLALPVNRPASQPVSLQHSCQWIGYCCCHFSVFLYSNHFDSRRVSSHQPICSIVFLLESLSLCGFNSNFGRL